jgi:outer membrane protein assembly factor BamD (BamD/ComL family)
VKQIDAARRALEQGGLTEALRLLAHYRRSYPRGALLPEAEIVAIEALARQGATQSAQARAEAFLRRSPADPHAPRVRRWLATSSQSP